MNDYKQISEEVLVSRSQLEKLNNENINFLISEAKKNRSKKINDKNLIINVNFCIF